jgi:type I restriction enzyme S subunit
MDEFNREDRLVIARFGLSEVCARFVSGQFFLNDSGLTLSPNIGTLLPRFVDYQMLCLNDDIYALGKGSAQKNLDVSAFRNLPLFIPSDTRVQQRVVSLLDEAFEGIATAKANARQNVANARALFESHLESVFNQRDQDCANRPLGELATFRNGINFTNSSRGESVRIVGVKDFQQHFWAPLDDLDTVTTDGALPDSDTLEENDILFVRSNGNMELIGRCLLVGRVADRIAHSGFAIRARLNGRALSAQYLCHFLKSNCARREMINSGIGTNIKA